MQTFKMELRTRLGVDYQVLALAGILALPDDAVDELIDLEMDSNPALTGGRISSADPFDTIAQSEPRPDTREELRQLARMSVEESDRPLVDLVVDSLDSRSRLTAAVPELARAARVDPARIRRAVAAVRLNGPAGTAATDLRECLLLQLPELRRSASAERPPRLVEAIIDRHLADVADGRTSSVAQALGARDDEVVAAVDFIRSRMRPFVVLDQSPWPPGPQSYRTAVRPDVLFRRGSDGSVRAHLQGQPPVAVTPSRAGQRPDDVDRARAFVHRLARRRATVLAVAAAIAERQQQFLLGQGPLVEMNQSQVAGIAGVDRSTVSRVISVRWANLPSGRPVPLSSFFTAPPAALTAMQQILCASTQPLSDARLARMLAAQGLPVARRTVANYRARLAVRLPPRRAREGP